MKQLALALCLLTAAVFVGCSPDRGDVSAQADPAAIAREIMEAANAEDVETFKSHLTTKAREGLDSDDGFQMNGGQFERYEIGTAVVTGDTAEVPVEAVQDGQEQSLTLQMRTEAGAWKLYAMGIELAEGMAMTINFEDMGSMLASVVEGMGEALSEGLETAFQDAMSGGSEEEIAKKKVEFESLSAVTSAEFESGWRNTEDFRGQSAADALAALAAGLDLAIDVTNHSAALARKVEADVFGLSRLEAMERIANEAGLYPEYPSIDMWTGGMVGAMTEALATGIGELIDSTISGLPDAAANADPSAMSNEAALQANAVKFVEGPRPWPVAFAGPYIVCVGELEENAPHATGAIAVVTKGFGFDTSVLTLKETLGETIRVGQVVDAQTRNLNAEEGVSYWGGGMASGSAFQGSTGIDLKNLLRDVEAIASLSGMRRLVLPTAVEVAEFSTLAEGASVQLGDYRATLKQPGTNMNFDVTGPKEGLEDLMVKFWPVDAQGNDLGIVYESADYWGMDKVQASLQTSEPPASVRMKLVTESEVLEYAFELKHIALTKSAEMPVALEALAFEGHAAPISVEFAAFTDRSDPDFPKVSVRAINHSNKDALNISAKFVYLDASGAILKDFPHTLQGSFSSEGFQAVVGQAANAEVETTAFFMPVETVSLHAEVEEIEFIDGTVWAREE